MPRKPSSQFRVIKARIPSELQETAAKLEQLRQIQRIVSEQECLRGVLAPDPTGDAVRRVHAYGYRRILEVFNRL